MALSEVDRNLLDRCLHRKPRAWEDFVDRYLGLVVHVTNHSAQARSIRLSPEDRDDLCAEVFLNVVRDDFHLLRQFRGQSSLATYLTVVARRIVVREMMKRKSVARLGQVANEYVAANAPAADLTGEHEMSDREEVERLIDRLDQHEAEVVRMYHLEGKSYQEISDSVGIAENSVGPMLSRARQKMRQAGADPATS